MRACNIEYYSTSYGLSFTRKKVTYSALHADIKNIWLDNISSKLKNKEEVSIISEWIVPVTVTAGVGGLVYALYHYRGR